MRRNPYLYAGALALGLSTTLALAQVTKPDLTQPDLNQPDANANVPNAPKFEVNGTPFPKMPLPSAGAYGTPLVFSTSTGKPKPWQQGEVAGVCIDSQDHVFTVNRGNLVNSPETLDSVPSAPVMEFDSDGNFVNAWGDRDILPNGLLGCFIDYQDNIWIAGNGDGIVQKYAHNGTLLGQIGIRGVCDNPPANTCGNSGANPNANKSTTLLNQPANMYIDPKRDPQSGRRGSVYIADGFGNHRVVVFQDNGNGTFTYLRQFGGVAGTPVNNPLTDFVGLFAAGDGGHPHCIRIAADDMVYACDRGNDRINVYDKMGVYQRTIAVVPGTGVTLGRNPVTGLPAPGLGTAGSAWDLVFTADGNDRFFVEADGGNEIVHIMRRTQGDIVGGFGAPGLSPGQFTFLHSVVVDSKGNLYTGETINGRRVQKFKRTD
jgi:hypothetical protein